MAYYSPRGDGLMDLDYGDGRKLALPLQAADLDAMGYKPVTADQPQLPSVPQSTIDVPGAMAANESTPQVGGDVSPDQMRDFVTDLNSVEDAQDSIVSQPQRGSHADPTTPVSFGNMPQPEPQQTEEPGPTDRGPAKPELFKASAAQQEQREDPLSKLLEPRYVPGSPEKDELISFQVKREGAPVSDDVKALQINAYQASLDAAKKKSDAESAAFQEQAAMSRKRASDMEAENVQQSVRLSNMREEYGDRLKEREQLRDDLKTKKVDPDRYFSEKSTAAQIGLVVSAAIGGFGAAMLGQNNPALGIIQDAIDKDIDAQKAEIELAKQGIVEADNEMAKMIQLYGSPEQAEANLRVAQMQAVEEKARAFALESQSEQAMANFEVFKAELDRGMADTLQQWDDRTQGMVVEQWQHQPARAGGYAAPDLEKVAKALATQRKIKENLVHLGLNPELSDQYVPGYGIIRSRRGYEGVLEFEQDFNKVMMAANESEKLVRDSNWSRGAGAFGFGTDEYQRARILEARMRIGEAKSYGGVMTDNDYETAGKTQPNLTAMVSDKAQALESIKQTREFWGNLRETLRSKAVVPGTQTPVRTLSGD